jgi:hypothetical protein
VRVQVIARGSQGTSQLEGVEAAGLVMVVHLENVLKTTGTQLSTVTCDHHAFATVHRLSGGSRVRLHEHQSPRT